MVERKKHFEYRKVVINLFLLSVTLMSLQCVQKEILSVEYKDRYKIKSNNTSKLFGGISAIEYDSISNSFFLLSDDRSNKADARYYNVNISYNKNKINTIIIDSVIYFKDQFGNRFQKETVDFESLRYSSKQQYLVVGNEGGKQGKPNISFFNLNGEYLKSLYLDSIYINNIRSNKGFEGLDFSKDNKYLFYTTEAPLTNEGNPSDYKHKGLIKILKQNIETNRIVDTINYYLEKLPQPQIVNPPWKGSGVDNGLAELLVLNDSLFITLERSGAYKGDNKYNFVCKLFANKIVNSNKGSFKKNNYLIKKQIFDFSSLPFAVFNIEGMTLGATIEGKQTLFFVSDNNFSDCPTTIYYFYIKI